jgi:hypothetical protein
VVSSSATEEFATPRSTAVSNAPLMLAATRNNTIRSKRYTMLAPNDIDTTNGELAGRRR